MPAAAPDVRQAARMTMPGVGAHDESLPGATASRHRPRRGGRRPSDRGPRASIRAAAPASRSLPGATAGRQAEPVLPSPLGVPAGAAAGGGPATAGRQRRVRAARFRPDPNIDPKMILKPSEPTASRMPIVKGLAPCAMR